MTGSTLLRIDLKVPVASFRDPQYSGAVRGLPLPPPATLRGMLAGVVGDPGYSPDIAYHSSADGAGIDLETYHPLSDKTNKKFVRGQSPFGISGGATISNRPFLTGLDISIWLQGADAEKVHDRIYRPVWGLRIGRSQDVVNHVRASEVVAQECSSNTLGHAVLPAEVYTSTENAVLRLASRTDINRLTKYGNFTWSKSGSDEHVSLDHNALSDPDKGLVYFL